MVLHCFVNFRFLDMRIGDHDKRLRVMFQIRSAALELFPVHSLPNFFDVPLFPPLALHGCEELILPKYFYPVPIEWVARATSFHLMGKVPIKFSARGLRKLLVPLPPTEYSNRHCVFCSRPVAIGDQRCDDNPLTHSRIIKVKRNFRRILVLCFTCPSRRCARKKSIRFKKLRARAFPFPVHSA